MWGGIIKKYMHMHRSDGEEHLEGLQTETHDSGFIHRHTFDRDNSDTQI